MSKYRESLELLEAAKVALDQMRRTVAPRDQFTAAVDRLDAAITAMGTDEEWGR